MATQAAGATNQSKSAEEVVGDWLKLLDLAERFRQIATLFLDSLFLGMWLVANALVADLRVSRPLNEADLQLFNVMQFVFAIATFCSTAVFLLRDLLLMLVDAAADVVDKARQRFDTGASTSKRTGESHEQSASP